MFSVAEKYSLGFIQDLQARYPGPYTVYYVKEINKVGCTRQGIERRKIQMENTLNITLDLPKVLFETDDLLLAAEKERENKAKYGIKWDTTDYVNDLKRHIVACTKKVREKVIKNTDIEKKFGRKTRKRMSEARPDKVKVIASEVLEVKYISQGYGKGSKKHITKSKYFRTFDSLCHAANYFTKKGKKMSPADIALILDPRFGHSVRHGYTFKKA